MELREFLGENFISINKNDQVTWDDIKHIVISLINDFYSDGKDFVIDKNLDEVSTDLNEIEKKNNKDFRSKDQTSCCKRWRRYQI